MNESDPKNARPWSAAIAVQEVPETGRRYELVADERSRAAVAKVAGIDALPRLEAIFDVSCRGPDGLHVVGEVAATAGQTCVVTLEPVVNRIEQQVDLVFSPAAALSAGESASRTNAAKAEGPEPLVGGVLDLGAIATEFLLLAIDPYPRKPGAVFEAPKAPDHAENPFAALAALKKGRSDPA